MEILKNKSVEKKEKILFAKTDFENKQAMLSQFDNHIVLFGICSNCDIQREIMRISKF